MLRKTSAPGAIAGILWAIAPGLLLAQQPPSPPAAPAHGLMISGDNPIFIDDQQPQNSFAIPRQDIRSSNAENGTLTLDLAKPDQGRSRPQSKLVLRFANPAAAQDAKLLFHATRAAAPSPAAIRTDESGNAPAAEPPGAMSFQVKHDHFIGNDTGRLIITPEFPAVEHLRYQRSQA